MQKYFLVLALALVAFPDLSAQVLPAWDAKAQDAWWSKNATPDQWAQAASDLQGQLEATYKQNGPACFANGDFQGWLDQLRWIRLGLDSPDLLKSGDNLKTFIALGRDEAVSHLFVEKIKPEDDETGALNNLLRLELANAADLHEYAALGVAYSLIWDQPFPSNWPHAQVSTSAVPVGDPDVVLRFQFYVQSNRDRKLDLDLTELSFDNLKYLVDSEVNLKELAAAQKNRISYSHFADAFFAIKYDDDRISNLAQQYDWPYPSYAVAEIEKHGGICIDQAYYASTVGKARGIPTIVFSGYGKDGAHAWFGYLSSSGKWELDCGRYENQSFPKGFAVDPQTWLPIDDTVLENLFKNGGTNTNIQPEMVALAWADLHRNDPSYAHILDDARTIMPEWSETWRRQANLVEKSGDIDKKKQFYQDWITQFGNYPEMKVEGQKRLYLDLKAANDADADGVLKDIIVQNRSEGFDLGLQAGQAEIDEKIKVQDWDGARVAFKNTIRDFGDQGGLTLFTKIIYPYVKVCLEANKLDLADEAITFTEDRIKFDADSQTGRKFTDLKNEVIWARKQAGHT